MRINKNYGEGVTSLDILNLNMVEVRQMVEMKQHIAEVLNSHNDKETKNKYLSDDDLKLLHAMLVVFTKEIELESSSAFTAELKAIEEAHQTDVADDFASKEV